ncbi:hypothetical protein PRIPAC_71727 [Pristionchus pacificus]|uniref:Lipase n=1 Tax=Pristionchus pacificus TaxID=54126 RepID=A0A2A6B4D4_PRIPA|nr:hypothetical protein PRIPAC_71727 [Pristionchus pacificus]|eukprot:PDM60737.1 lipase [Pristionchus pacificus]
MLLASLISLISIPSAFSLSILYNHKRGRETLNVAAAAYSDNPLRCLSYTFPNSNYKILTTVEVPCDSRNHTCAMFAAISVADKRIFVSFRGTTTNEQLVVEGLESLENEVDWYGVGQVNRYFYEATEILWKYLERHIDQPSSSHFRIMFTGHSLGGAMATLAAMKTHVKKLRPKYLISLFTYGEPRVGNRVFAHNVQAAITDGYRVVHRADMVPHLPPCKDLGAGCDPMDFRRPIHHSVEIWYPDQMGTTTDFIACTDTLDSPHCSNSISPKYNWEDHRWYFGVYVYYHGQRDYCEVPFPERDQQGVKKSSASISLLSLSLTAYLTTLIT